MSSYFKIKLRNLMEVISTFGIQPLLFVQSLIGIPAFLKDYFKFRQANLKYQKTFPIKRIYPCLYDRYLPSGNATGHYFYQDLIVARKIFLNKPHKHIDIGSRIDGFVSHVASFREIEVMDIRYLKSPGLNIKFKQYDLMSKNFNLVDYCDSISSLHAIEHFGLGRYGDQVDPNGYLIGLENIYKMLQVRGKFYFSVPIGEQRIEFNAQRIFGINYLIELFNKRYKIDSFSCVDDQGQLLLDVNLEDMMIQKKLPIRFGCGIFELTKL